MTSDLAIHVRKLLAARLAEHAAQVAKIAELEALGHRIVNGGQDGEGWDLRDWRTREVISQSDSGDSDAFDAMYERLDPDQTWYHIDHIWEETGGAIEVEPTPGIPASLAQALEEWVDTRVPAEDIAEVAEWSVEEVNRHLAEVF